MHYTEFVIGVRYALGGAPLWNELSSTWSSSAE